MIVTDLKQLTISPVRVLYRICILLKKWIIEVSQIKLSKQKQIKIKFNLIFQSLRTFAPSHIKRMIVPPKVRNIISPIFGLGLKGPEHGLSIQRAECNLSPAIRACEPVGEPLSCSLRAWGSKGLFNLKRPHKTFNRIVHIKCIYDFCFVCSLQVCNFILYTWLVKVHWIVILLLWSNTFIISLWFCHLKVW